MNTWHLRITLLAMALVVLALTATCAGGQSTPSQTPTQLEVAMSLYCADLTLLDSTLTLAGADQSKRAAAETEYASKLYADADRVDAAGDKNAAVKIRTMTIALAIDGQARQKADTDPALLNKFDADAAAAIHDAPSCPRKG